MFECGMPTSSPAMVRVWTGRESEALRHASHLSVDEFARLIGVSRRAVAYWRQRGSEVQLRWEVQRLLDGLLTRAEPSVAARFQEALAEEEADVIELQTARYRKILGL